MPCNCVSSLSTCKGSKQFSLWHGCATFGGHASHLWQGYSHDPVLYRVCSLHPVF